MKKWHPIPPQRPSPFQFALYKEEAKRLADLRHSHEAFVQWTHQG